MKIDINVPDGQSGPWKIITKTVEDPDALTLARAMLRDAGRYVPAGEYKVLLREKEVIMSNTPDEVRDFFYFTKRATGDVLVNGLGLGVVLKALLDNPQVTSVTVIEQSEDVIKLVAPTYSDDPKVTIVHADAYEWIPPKGKVYDYVWHDIWDNITSDNLSGMIKLHRKYGRRSKYQESWCRDLCERMRGNYY